MKDRERLNAKLRRLRKDGRPRSAGASRGLPDRLRAQLASRAGRRSSPDSETQALPPTEKRDVGAPKELTAMSNRHGSFALRARRFPVDHRHGDWCLGEIDAANVGDIARLAKDQALREVDWRRALYLDIEITGLSGGAGTIPFLVAMGVFEDDEFVLYQGFLNGPEEEAAMLQDVAERVSNSTALVSFFGKSFDRHRLEDKMRVHGIEPPFADRPHLDLYHPLRRLYGGAFADGKLSTMETELCGVLRQDDLSGRFAPEAWFDFLAERAHRLEDVFRHNEDDVLSLVVLAAHLGRAFEEERGDGQPLGGPSGARAFAIAHLLSELRSHEEALPWIERGLDRAPAEMRRLRLLQADACAALVLTAEDATAVRCLVSLAKGSEHKARDPRQALVYVRRAVKLCRTRVAVSGSISRDLAKRGERLLGKIENVAAGKAKAPKRSGGAASKQATNRLG